MSNTEPTIYVVTSDDGDTSTIRAVFTEKELAEKFVEVFNSTHNSWDDRASIETYIANPHRQVLEGGRQYFKVSMDKDGCLTKDVEVLQKNLDKVSTHRIYADRSCLELCLWAANGADAVDIANKHRQLLVETGQW